MSSNFVSIKNGACGQIINVSNKLADASISVYAGHVISFVPKGEKPVIWMSSKTYDELGKPIRGGVPICWPWFGPSQIDGFPSHGVARLCKWEYLGSEDNASGETIVALLLNDSMIDAKYRQFAFELRLIVTIGKKLSLRLVSLNKDKKDITINCALHTYFAVSKIEDILIRGVENTVYFDKVLKLANQKSGNEALIIDREIDRIYAPTSQTVVVEDKNWQRKIIIAKHGSNSTVIWNPWIDKSKIMVDFGDDEYHSMLCVECTAINDYALQLGAGEEKTIEQIISIEH